MWTEVLEVHHEKIKPKARPEGKRPKTRALKYVAIN